MLRLRLQHRQAGTVMTFFLVMLINAAALPSHNKPLRDKYYDLYHDQSRDAIDDLFNKAIASPYEMSESLNKQTDCTQEFRENMNLVLLQESITVLLKKGVKGRDIVKEAMNTVDNFKTVADMHYTGGKTDEASKKKIHNFLLEKEIPLEKYDTRSQVPYAAKEESDFLEFYNSGQPSVILEVEGSHPANTNQISIDMMPLMGINDVFQQAYLEYIFRYPDEEMNPFTFDLRKISGCYEIISVAGEMSQEPFHWLIQVFSNTNKLIYSGRCIPSKMDVPVKSGYLVRVIFTAPTNKLNGFSL